MELKLKTRVRGVKYDSNSHSTVRGAVEHQAAVRIPRSPAKTQELVFQLQEHSLLFSSICGPLQAVLQG